MPNVRHNTVKLLTCHLQNALQFHRRLYRRKIVPHKYIRILNLPYCFCYMTIIFLLVKFAYFANIILNFQLMCNFLRGSNQNSFFGWTAVTEILNGTQWHQTGYFPRVTICDFKVSLKLYIKTLLS